MGGWLGVGRRDSQEVSPGRFGDGRSLSKGVDRWRCGERNKPVCARAAGWRPGKIALTVTLPASWFWPAGMLDPQTGRVEILGAGYDADMNSVGWTDAGRKLPGAEDTFDNSQIPLTTGSKLGPYEIVSLLGKGGMGEVAAGGVCRRRCQRREAGDALDVSASLL